MKCTCSKTIDGANIVAGCLVHDPFLVASREIVSQRERAEKAERMLGIALHTIESFKPLVEAARGVAHEVDIMFRGGGDGGLEKCPDCELGPIGFLREAMAKLRPLLAALPSTGASPSVCTCRATIAGHTSDCALGPVRHVLGEPVPRASEASHVCPHHGPQPGFWACPSCALIEATETTDAPEGARTNEARRRVTIVNDARFAGYTGEEIGPGRVAIVVTVDPSDVVSETGSKAP